MAAEVTRWSCGSLMTTMTVVAAVGTTAMNTGGGIMAKMMTSITVDAMAAIHKSVL